METLSFDPSNLQSSSNGAGSPALDPAVSAADSTPVSANAPVSAHVALGSASAPGALSAEDPQSQFWQTPPAGQDGALGWHVPPTPACREFLAPCEELLHRVEDRILELDLPMNAVQLLWKFVTGARGAQVELERLCQAIDPKIEELRDEMAEHEKTCVSAISEAGLPYVAAGPQDPGPGESFIHPARIEKSLLASLPGIQEIAGGRRVEPVEEGKSTPLQRAGSILIDFLASLVCGFMVAICLGTLVGLVKLSDLGAGVHIERMVVAALLGFVIVKITGKLYYNVTGMLARFREPRLLDAEDAMVCSRHRSAWVVAFFVVLALNIWMAELTAEATGLRLLYLQAVTDPFSHQTAEAPAPYIYFIIGMIMSGFYLLFKASQAWKEAEMRLREAWLLHKQGEYLEQKRQSTPVKQAFFSAYRVHTLSRDLKALKTLRDAARSAAVGETVAFQHHLERLIFILEPLPDSSSSTGLLGRFQRLRGSRP